ncbi:MAG: hypothetical protein KDI19_06630 [Pseudomonadales bacterium]|nr:hypothetical protein [Pseudomonadales bacterium]
MRVLVFVACLLPASAAIADPLDDCRRIDGEHARVACYDRVVDARAPESEPAALSQDAPVTSHEKSAAQEDDALFGKHESESIDILKEKAGVANADAIERSVAAVTTGAFGKLLVELDNGQAWRQLDNGRLPLQTGDRVRIEKASFGSYLLVKATGSRSIRVKRVR